MEWLQIFELQRIRFSGYEVDQDIQRVRPWDVYFLQYDISWLYHFGVHFMNCMGVADHVSII